MRWKTFWLISAVWLGLAPPASIISIRVVMSVAPVEIMVGTVAGNTIGLQFTDWVNFLAGFDAVLLTFPGGHRDRLDGDPEAFLVEHLDWRRRLPCCQTWPWNECQHPFVIKLAPQLLGNVRSERRQQQNQRLYDFARPLSRCHQSVGQFHQTEMAVLKRMASIVDLFSCFVFRQR